MQGSGSGAHEVPFGRAASYIEKSHPSRRREEQMKSENPIMMINGQWLAHAPGGRKKTFATYDEAVAWIVANGQQVVRREK
jgi:hypothetical protein